MLSIISEDQITVDDHGQTGTQSRRPLSQYLAADVSNNLINPTHPQTYATLEAELASITAIIDSLHVLQVFKRRKRNHHIPVSTLPPEILSEVFITCMDEYETSDFKEPPSTTLPLIFGQVCHFWRTVSQNTPQIWNVVHCHISQPQNLHTQATMLLQWLNRSKSLPLTIKLSFLDEEAWISRNSPTDIIDVVLQFSDRWRNVDMVLPISWYGRLRSAQFNSLEVLHIRPPGPVKYYGKRLRGFSNAPKLRIISYDSFFLRYLDLPWMKLTNASIGGPSIDEVLEFVSRCPDLMHLHIIDPTVDQGTFPVALRTHFSLQNLSFTMHHNEGDFIPPNFVINLLKTPFLQSISVELLPTDNNSPLPSIAALIKRSNCQLIQVTILGPQLDEEEVIHFLGDNEPVLRVLN